MGDEINFKIEANKKVGRYAVASKDLKAGDIIFSEAPFVYGPKADSPVLCLSCCTPVDATVLCSKCSWPVCNSDCENMEIHSKNECQIFQKSGVKFQKVDDPSEVCLQLDCVTPLRMLLATESQSERWKNEVSIMESHDDIRKEKPIWEFNKNNIVDYIRGPCKLERFSEELIHKVCGILEMNAFEARNSSGYSFRCLFPKYAILSHNCISNTHYAVDCTGNGKIDDCRAYVRVTIDVPKDGELYSSYTHSLWPTLVRREFLRESKYFECDCKRCSDPTELGTHSSSLKCQKCDNGVILSTNPLDDLCEWKCTHCEFKTHGGAVRRIFAAIQNDIDSTAFTVGNEGIEAREQLFRKYRSVLHPKNSYMNILRSELTQLYGKADNYSLEELPDLILERKVELCNMLLEVLNVIEPGMSRIRAVTLYELHAPLMVLARHEYQNDVINKDVFSQKLKHCIDILGEAASILKHEPVSQPEGQLGQMVQMAHAQLTENFDTLVETAYYE